MSADNQLPTDLTPEQLGGLTEELVPMPTAEQLEAVKRELGHPANWWHEWNTIAPLVRAQALEEAAKAVEDGIEEEGFYGQDPTPHLEAAAERIRTLK